MHQQAHECGQREPLKPWNERVDFRRFKFRFFNLSDVVVIDISHVDPLCARWNISRMRLGGDLAQYTAVKLRPNLLSLMFNELS